MLKTKKKKKKTIGVILQHYAYKMVASKGTIFLKTSLQTSDSTKNNSK